ncbi:hypothetical protein ACHAWT_007138 [Skeletonema menzelii]|mmetsp:Transcript_11926/g.19543  ORF Transcript_11926/g.19543 Transcript_11926/m.19543 type:complete len:380 (+) Transcript_11926:57-1196(+)
MEHLLSTNHCKLLRCALDVINRTKSADAMRITTAPIDYNEITAKPKTPQTNTNPHSSQNELQDRVQRRKEKKRRKIEHRKQHQEVSTIKSEVVTTTSFCDFSTNTNSDSSQLSIPPSVRAIIHVKPLIILDVNGILCHRLRHKSQELLSPASSSSYRRAKQKVTFRPSIGHIANTDIVPRSDLHQFLTLVNNRFSLAVWTSATRKTAKQLVRLLFPDEIRENLVFIWHRNFCTLVENKDKGQSQGSDASELESNSNKTNKSQKKPSHEDLIAIKSLSKVWASYPIWNATNTLLLDDSPEKCPTKYRKNALHPTKICGTITDIGGVFFDNDEENQKKQRCFFELLANTWSETSSSEYLSSFLKDNAKEYNMGWCMPECTI